MKSDKTCIRECANVDMINGSINQLEELNKDVAATCQLLNLMGNETRFKILFLVKNNQRLCVCDLSDILGISISAVSQQLSKLKNGGLLTKTKEAQTIYYSIAPLFEVKVEQLFIVHSPKLTS
ncbi:MAG: DNA-binding transcriptional ArsR family regulator [Psychromonas sp.]|jgi:DNA-binding transcriptional ArsR family regulator